MIERTIVRIYAEALYQLADERGQVEEVYEEIRYLEGLFHESKELADFLSSPQVDRDDKKGLINKVVKPHFSPLTYHFLLTVIDKNREILIPYLANEFKEILDRIHNRIDVDITSAVPLPDDIKERLIRALSGVLDKEIIPHMVTDPKILGGFVVRVKDRIMDASILGQLEGLRAQLLDH
jgi:F-type H+-transporting ATPase subunit delta